MHYVTLSHAKQNKKDESMSDTQEKKKQPTENVIEGFGRQRL